VVLGGGKVFWDGVVRKSISSSALLRKKARERGAVILGGGDRTEENSTCFSIETKLANSGRCEKELQEEGRSSEAKIADSIDIKVPKGGKRGMPALTWSQRGIGAPARPRE